MHVWCPSPGIHCFSRVNSQHYECARRRIDARHSCNNMLSIWKRALKAGHMQCIPAAVRLFGMLHARHIVSSQLATCQDARMSTAVLHAWDSTTDEDVQDDRTTITREPTALAPSAPAHFDRQTRVAIQHTSNAAPCPVPTSHVESSSRPLLKHCHFMYIEQVSGRTTTADVHAALWPLVPVTIKCV